MENMIIFFRNYNFYYNKFFLYEQTCRVFIGPLIFHFFLKTSYRLVFFSFLVPFRLSFVFPRLHTPLLIFLVKASKSRRVFFGALILQPFSSCEIIFPLSEVLHVGRVLAQIWHFFEHLLIIVTRIFHLLFF